MYGANTLGLSDIRAPLNWDEDTPANVIINLHDAAVNLAGPWRCWESDYYDSDPNVVVDNTGEHFPGGPCVDSGGMKLHFTDGVHYCYFLWMLPFYRSNERREFAGNLLRSA